MLHCVPTTQSQIIFYHQYLASIAPTPLLLVTTIVLSVCVSEFQFCIPHMSEIIWSLAFSDWLTSLSIIFSRSICCRWELGSPRQKHFKDPCMGDCGMAWFICVEKESSPWVSDIPSPSVPPWKSSTGSSARPRQKPVPNQTRKSNKKHPNWKGGNETVTVCRWHDSVHGKS